MWSWWLIYLFFFVSVSLSLQFLGTWYEVERSFYLPELASSCTMLSFEEEASRENDALPSRLEVAVKSINQWYEMECINCMWFKFWFTGSLAICIYIYCQLVFKKRCLLYNNRLLNISLVIISKYCRCYFRTGTPSINLGFAHPETRTSSIMDFKVNSIYKYLNYLSVFFCPVLISFARCDCALFAWCWTLSNSLHRLQ